MAQQNWIPDADNEPPAPLRFERRQTDRWAVDGIANAFELGGQRFGRKHRLRIVDYSDGGIGALSDTVLAPGTVISLGFETPGYAAKRGEIIRCMPCGDGYRVAIAFERRMAA